MSEARQIPGRCDCGLGDGAGRHADGCAIHVKLPLVDSSTGCCAECDFPLLRLGPGANAWTLRASEIEQAARALEEGLDAQDVPAAKREALLRLRVALATK